MQSTNNRINTIDRLRGLSVLLMVIANFLKHFDNVPSWMKHADPYGLTFVDFIAPCFFFIIGLTVYISFNNRLVNNDKNEVHKHFRMRALALVVIGSVLSLIDYLLPYSNGFEVNILQAISLAILIAIPFFTTKFYVNVIIGVSVGFIEHLLLVLINGLDYALDEIRAIGIVGWIGLIFLTLAMGKLFFICRNKNSYRLYAILSAAYILSGTLLSFWIPISHSAATLSYNLITSGVVAAIFLGTYLLTENRMPKRGIFTLWGSNPLFAFVVHFLLISIVRTIPIIFGFSENSSIYFIISLILYLSILQGMLFYLFQKKVYIKV